MRVIYHQLAVRDVWEILDHYESEADARLADRFYAELLALIDKAVGNPQHFRPVGIAIRRANLTGFPYHFLYEEKLWGIKVLVVRHHRRNPQYGLRRR